MHQQWYYDDFDTCCLYQDIITNKIVCYCCSKIPFCIEPNNPNIKLLDPISVPNCNSCKKLAEGIERGSVPRYYYPYFHM